MRDSVPIAGGRCRDDPSEQTRSLSGSERLPAAMTVGIDGSPLRRITNPSLIFIAGIVRKNMRRDLTQIKVIDRRVGLPLREAPCGLPRERAW